MLSDSIHRTIQARAVDTRRRLRELFRRGRISVTRQITGPFDDEFLRPLVEVAITKRRGIDRVKELAELRDADFDSPASVGIVAPADERAPDIDPPRRDQRITSQ